MFQSEAGPVLSERTVARGACFADYENDGKVDAFLVNLGAKGTLLHNVSTNTGHWIALKLVGTKSNRDGIGARVEVDAGDRRWTAERVAGSGYLSQDDGRLHFGLGAATAIDKIDRALAQWARTDARKAERRSRADRGGAEVNRREAQRSAWCGERTGRHASRWRWVRACASGADGAAHLWRPDVQANGWSYASPLEILFLARWRAALRALPAERRSARAGCEELRGDQEHSRWAVCRAAFSLSPTGDRLFVTNSWDDTLSVIDTRRWSCGNVDGGRGAFRCGRGSRRASACLWRTASATMLPCSMRSTGAEEKRLVAGRGASYLTPSPDGSRIYATHVYPNPDAHIERPPESEITVIDAARAVVVDRIPLPSIAHGFHLAFSADGRLGAAAEYHPKNLVPLAHLEHGGAFAYTLTLFGADVGKPVEVPLDELERYAVAAFWRGDLAGQVADLRDLRRIGDGHRHRCAAPDAVRAYAPGSNHCARSVGQCELCGGAHSGGAQSARLALDQRWDEAVCGESAG